MHHGNLSPNKIQFNTIFDYPIFKFILFSYFLTPFCLIEGSKSQKMFLKEEKHIFKSFSIDLKNMNIIKLLNNKTAK